MTQQLERLDDRPPNPLLDALDILQKYERGELNNVIPEDLVYFRALQAIKMGLSRHAIAETTV